MDNTWNIKSLEDSIREKYQSGEISLHDAAVKFYLSGWDNFVNEEETKNRLSK